MAFDILQACFEAVLEADGPSICNECGQPFDGSAFESADDPLHVFCDICGEHEHPADMTPDWNGETGCHLSCEQKERLT